MTSDARFRVFACCALALGCNSDKKTPPVDGRAPLASASVSAPAPTVAAPKPRPERAADCRAVVAKGDIRLVSGAALRQGSALKGDEFVVLASGARLVVRHSVSTRELEVAGPATVLLCEGGEENAVLSNGVLRSVAGPGARPGATVLVGHPWGTLSYGNAQVELTVDAKGATARAGSGEAWVKPSNAGKLKGPAHLNHPKQRARITGPAVPADLVKECERAAAESSELAKSVLAQPGPDAEPLGARAAAHLKARAAAREACAAAGAAAQLATDPAEAARLQTALKTAKNLWKSVPKARK